MRNSIRVRLTVVLIVIMIFVINGTLFLDNTFASQYYIMSEKSSLIKNYKKMNNILTKSKSEAMTIANLQNYIYTSNEKVMIARMDEGTQTPNVFCTNIYRDSTIYDQTVEYLYWLHIYILLESKTQEDYGEEDENYGQWLEGLSVFDFDDVIEKGYVVRRIANSTDNKKDLILFGTTDNNYLVAMRISLDDIQTSVHINSQFLTYMGIIGVFVGSILMFIISFRFTKPIKDMARVANRMTNLDFDARVEIHSDDELGELAESMNKMSSTLESTIADLKTANLELQKDIEKKEKIDEMRKEFLSHVSHELKTPIALIQGYAEGLKENINDDEESKDFYCEVIADEAQKMNLMVRKLLTLNQIEFGNNQIKIIRFDIAQMIYNKINSNSILFQKKNVTVEFPQEKEKWVVWGDEFMIEEVISNYISNALNHVYESGTIKIWLEKREKSVYTHVFNEGKQIPESELGKLWTKFYKVDKARTREYGGSGIGLSIVQATMKAHEKDYGVKNVENGVEFYFELEAANA